MIRAADPTLKKKVEKNMEWYWGTIASVCTAQSNVSLFEDANYLSSNMSEGHANSFLIH